jgi:hypothetical protein
MLFRQPHASDFMQMFWWLLTMSAVVWYSTITVYISVKGVQDIRQMLARLKSQQSSRHTNE